MELKIQDSKENLSQDFSKQEFKSEEDEANYWDNHQDGLATAFEQAAENGTLGHGTAVRQAKEHETVIPWYLIVLGAPIVAISSIGNFFKRTFGKK